MRAVALLPLICTAAVAADTRIAIPAWRGAGVVRTLAPNGRGMLQVAAGADAQSRHIGCQMSQIAVAQLRLARRILLVERRKHSGGDVHVVSEGAGHLVPNARLRGFVAEASETQFARLWILHDLRAPGNAVAVHVIRVGLREDFTFADRLQQPESHQRRRQPN